MFRIILVFASLLILLANLTSAAPLRPQNKSFPRTTEEEINPTENSSVASWRLRHRGHQDKRFGIKVIDSKAYTLVLVPKRRRRSPETRINEIIRKLFNSATKNKINQASKSHHSTNATYNNCFFEQLVITSNIKLSNKRCR